MGIIKLSQKAKRSPTVGDRYWADRGMTDFMPSVAYDVPVEGGIPPAETISKLRSQIAAAEVDLNPFNQVGVHIEVHNHGYLTITIGVFAT